MKVCNIGFVYISQCWFLLWDGTQPADFGWSEWQRKSNHTSAAAQGWMKIITVLILNVSSKSLSLEQRKKEEAEDSNRLHNLALVRMKEKQRAGSGWARRVSENGNKKRQFFGHS